MFNINSVKKLIAKSSYNAKKKEFSIVFKDIAVAKLVQLLLGDAKQRGKVVKVTVDDNTTKESLLTLLELTS